ncbi:MAG: alkaline phosphatase family protein [Phycisphaerae bacterium]|nr:alkaline phosphatase family protein [Phycisphaerae bacterium]
MSINKILKISIMILFAYVFTDIAIALDCPDGNAPVITSPNDNEVYLAGGTFADLCKATGDTVITWSGGGSFDPTTGSCTDYTAPSTKGTVTITATNSYGSDQVEIKTADIIYVDEDAAPGGGGTSWADAFDTLQEGLSAASSGNHVWVAEGIYKPGTLTTNTFQLEDGVEVYGGFDPTKSDDTWAERDYINNVTTLSGDIDGDDTLNNTNSHHVVTCQDANSSTVLDGFTITMGFADSGLCDGAGMKITSASPTVSNCIFKGNRAYGGDGDGGGMSCLYSSPTVTNCIFLNNIAGDDGGALVNSKGSNGTFTNCVFYGNNTNGENVEGGQGKSNGGAIWNTCGETYNVAGSSPKFINCLIAGNSTVPGSNNGGKNGGGVANKGADTDPVFINCTFTANTANWDGGGMCTKDYAEPTVINCIFWDNSTGAGYYDVAICDKDYGATTVSYSDLDQSGYAPDDNNISQDPNFADSGDPDGPDNRFLTCDDGFRICFDSNCVDAGNGTATDAPETDILGFERVDIRAVTNSGQGTPYSDMGAYEAVVEHAIFISVDGFGSHSSYLDSLLAAGDLPNMKDYFMDGGMWTDNARAEYTFTKTIPAHTTMITGRPVDKPVTVPVWPNSTTHHGWEYNDGYSGYTPSRAEWMLHGYYKYATNPDKWTGNENNYNNPGNLYMASPFDIVHDRSMSTALYANKDKFELFERSYNAIYGRDDQVPPYIDGKDKMTHYTNNSSTDPNYLISALESTGMDNFVFFHFRGPDSAGHLNPGGGWGSTAWDNAVIKVDNYLAKIFDMVKASSNEDKPWYYNTVVIMTADHGGIDYNHGGSPADLRECQLPFGVWGHLIPKDVDPYDYCDLSRKDPGSVRGPNYNTSFTDQPIRHADGVDLALNLMGLPEIDGALIKGMKLKLP